MIWLLWELLRADLVTFRGVEIVAAIPPPGRKSKSKILFFEKFSHFFLKKPFIFANRQLLQSAMHKMVELQSAAISRESFG